MSPEYLNELADISDPEQLWRLSPLDRLELEPIQRMRLDTGVALRRHAEHVSRLRELIGTGKSLLITPLSKNSNAVMTMPAPESHRKLLRHHQSTTTSEGGE